MFRAILGLIPALLFGIILFLINPILGVLWVLWLVVLVIYVVRKDLIIKFLRWLFRVDK
jgi:hypothetical protein